MCSTVSLDCHRINLDYLFFILQMFFAEWTTSFAYIVFYCSALFYSLHSCSIDHPYGDLFQQFSVGSVDGKKIQKCRSNILIWQIVWSWPGRSKIIARCTLQDCIHFNVLPYYQFTDTDKGVKVPVRTFRCPVEHVMKKVCKMKPKSYSIHPKREFALCTAIVYSTGVS